jgi:Ribbon-helix-helix protein, copG family
MKTISVTVSKEDYEAFRRAARRTKRSIAQLIRESMAFYRQEKLEERSRLTEIPVLVGHRPRESALPTRAELYEEMFEARPRPLS